MIRARWAIAVVVVGAAAAGCAGPPWLMGRPLDGQASIPPTTLNFTTAQYRTQAAEARAAGLIVDEFEPLQALETLERLTPGERARLVDLLLQRARDFEALARAIPRSQDMEHAIRLDPLQGPVLRPLRARALRDAGDAWLTIGDRARAQEAFRQAEELGAFELSFRLLAATDQAPAERTPLGDLQRAIAELPLRALRPFGDAYLRQRGDDRPTLERLLAAARQDSDPTQTERLREALARLPPLDSAPAVSPSVAPLASVNPWPPVPAELERWVLGGPTLSRRLLPLLAADGRLMAPGARARRWSALLLAEDPTSPAVQEVAALIDGFDRRFGGTERKLTDLVYYSSDRFDGFLRAAAVWERVGRPREACVERVRAARWRDDPEDGSWRDAIACTRGDPGAGDWRAIRQYVLDRAPADRRQALAASLDAADEKTPAPAPVARPAP